MSKTFKSIVAAAAAALTVGVFSIGAAASTQEMVGTTSFNDRVPDRGSLKSGPLKKTNDNTFATVHLNEGSTSSPATPVQFRVYRQGVSFAVTGIATIYASDERDLDYQLGMGVNGNYYTLYMNAGYYGAGVDGYWTA